MRSTGLALLLFVGNAGLTRSTSQLRGIGPHTSSPTIAGQKKPNATWGAALPGIVDVWKAFPPVHSFVEKTSSNSSLNVAVAVCVTGHLRTFVLPGVYSGLVANLLRTVPGRADVFMVGHLGQYKGSDNAIESMEMEGVMSSDDPGLKAALSLVGADASNTKITAGDCSSLEAAWRSEGVSGRVCTGEGNFMQIMWLDECIQMVRRSGESYDLVVRTRPDVGVFAPMPWPGVSLGSVSYMPKDAGGRADWFFTIPWPMVAAWWDAIANLYASGSNGVPDYTIFNAGSETLAEANFPAAIVRGRRSAQCFRLVGSAAYAADCEQKAAAGYFEELHV